MSFMDGPLLTVKLLKYGKFLPTTQEYTLQQHNFASYGLYKQIAVITTIKMQFWKLS